MEDVRDYNNTESSPSLASQQQLNLLRLLLGEPALVAGVVILETRREDLGEHFQNFITRKFLI